MLYFLSVVHGRKLAPSLGVHGKKLPPSWRRTQSQAPRQRLQASRRVSGPAVTEPQHTTSFKLVLMAIFIGSYVYHVFF